MEFAMKICFLFIARGILPTDAIQFSFTGSSEAVFRRIYSISLVSCRKECMARRSCWSINYFRYSKKCELSQFSDATSDVIRRPGCVYSKKQDWTDNSYAVCDCVEGETCIFSEDGHRCVTKECTKLASQDISHMNTVGAKSKQRIKCIQNITQFDIKRELSVCPLVCSSDGSWSVQTPHGGRRQDVVFVARPGNTYDPYIAWTQGIGSLSDLSCLKSQSCNLNYRSDFIDDWESMKVNEVRFSVFKNHSEVQYVTFNGTGSTNLDWFSKNRVLESSWVNMKSSRSNIFSLEGHHTGIHRKNVSSYRRFYMNAYFNTCENDNGWFAAVYFGKMLPYCFYEIMDLPKPYFLFSKDNTSSTYHANNVDVADYVYIIVVF